MTPVIRAKGLARRYGSTVALDGVDFEIPAGRIVGLIGPNGAGKTTALKAILGLGPFEGQLEVLGLDPRRQRAELMRQVSFIADVAVLPRWLRVRQALDITAGLHPRFSRERAEAFLARTEIKRDSKISALSKGMVTQLHLALVMAIDARLLVLDEPTLGLDIIYRKEFYAALLNDYFDEERTILLTTHQVEEVEHILTDLMFISQGRIVLDESMDTLGEKYLEVATRPDGAEAARRLGPLYERQGLGRHHFIFEGRARSELEPLGEIRLPGVADLFVAKVRRAAP
ncbi:ABC transporter ATP-binding protein [Wenzhouxiangella sp. XN24]|uniref:ATP-binding cassette domain-containing protein n=1 Tax=Wenzhouxiangella sp. XN24 TaxID=2713569 RepID=UPI0013ED8269|nr:ABC transporter ATP-binding protein [Wenzhouxiangella sp. XN24]